MSVWAARWFSLNVSNFYTTDEEIGYGEAISGLTNGSHYVIDTSRNGAGPAPDAPLNWCNPQRPRPGRTAHHGDRGRARRRLPVDQTSRGIGRNLRSRGASGGSVR